MTRTFESDEAAAAWADKWSGLHLPSQVVLDISAGEREHFIEFNRDDGRFVCQFEVQFRPSPPLSTGSTLSTKGLGRHIVRFSLYCRLNVKSFNSALDRLARGYYEDCFAMTHGLYETFIRLMWISCHPNDAYAAVVRKPPAGVPQFNLTGFLSDELKLSLGGALQRAVGVWHSSSHQVLLAMATHRSARRRAGAVRSDGRLQVRARGSGWSTAQLHPSRPSTFRGRAPHWLGDKSGRVCAQARTRINRSSDYGMASHSKEHWRDVAADLDALFVMIEIADKDGDWRSAIAEHSSSRPVRAGDEVE